jgi:HSP20 family protein
MPNEIQAKESQVEPWTDLDRAFDAMRRRFAEAFGISPFGVFDGESALRSPRTDVTDTGKSYMVRAEIPGIPKEKLDIRIRGPVVEIRGENSSDTEQKAEQFLHRERTYSGYYRALELPEPVVAADAKAKVVNGVLELDLPKQDPTPSEEEVKVSVQ